MIWQKDSTPTVQNYFLEPGYLYLPSTPTIISTVLGSSVGVSIYDTKRNIGAMNHFLYPSTYDRAKATGIYGNVATMALVKMLIDRGSNIKHLEAQILGGAFDPKVCEKNIGFENIGVAKSIILKKGVKIVSEDTGGTVGRKIMFNTLTGEIVIIKVEQLRLGDWFPYNRAR